MKQTVFEARYRDEWALFAAALDHHVGKKAPSGGSAQSASGASETGATREQRLTADMLAPEQLVPAYRRICQHLAVARGRHYSPHMVEQLNNLALRGHHFLYGRKNHFGEQLASFFSFRFPALVRANIGLFWLANLLFYGPLILMAVICYLRPETIYLMQSPENVSAYEEMYSPEGDRLGPRAQERDAGDDFTMFGFYIYNNISIAFQCFALGVLAGVGTIFVQVFNGLHIGATMGYLVQFGASTPFFTFVIAHGAFELTAIVLAGMAGLMLGRSVLMPGRYSRTYALRLAATDAVQVVWGIFVMLLIAAFVEAFWSSINQFEPWVKYSVGAACWALVFAYFAFLGRLPRENKPSLLDNRRRGANAN